MENERDAFCPSPLVTLAVKAKVPLAEGVPPIDPVPAFSARPPGSEPLVIDQPNEPSPPVA
jgi:hypothetical protein